MNKNNKHESNSLSTEEYVWLRNLLVKLLGMGFVVAAIFLGWVLTEPNEVFDFYGERKQQLAAIGLVLVTPILYHYCPVRS